MNTTKSRPLAKIILFRLLLSSSLFALLLISINLIYEYQKTRESIQKDIETLVSTFTPGVESAVWDYQQPLLQSLITGISANPSVVYAEITTLDGALHAEWQRSGEEPSKGLTTIKKLQYSPIDSAKLDLGTMTISSSESMVWRHLQETGQLLGIDMVLILLFVPILIWVLLRGQVIRPIVLFSQQVTAQPSDSLLNFVDIGKCPSIELATLQGRFNALVKQINEHQTDILLENATLEDRVFAQSKEVRIQEQRFGLIFEKANTGIVFADITGTISFCNESFANMLGYELSEIKGKTITEISVADDMVENRELMAELIAGWRSHYRLEKRYYHKDGTILWGDLSVSILRGLTADDCSIIGMVVDITERKNSELALQIARDEAEAANRGKSEFLANMSHEIRTPLNAVIGFSELLASEIVDPRHKTHINAIHSGGKNLLVLINDILDLSKIDAGQMDITPVSTNIHGMIHELKAHFSHTAQNKGLNLIFLTERSLPSFLILDGTHLRQVVTNIIGNALKFTRIGSVTVAVSYTNFSRLIVEVTDTGIGIAETMQTAIYEKFHQQEGQRDRRFGGVGLGLSIAKQLVELMEGTISLVSEEGKGSVFTISIPAEVDISISDFVLENSLQVKSDHPTEEPVENMQKASDEDLHFLTEMSYEIDHAVSPLQFDELQNIARLLTEKIAFPEIEEFAQNLIDNAQTMNIDGLLAAPRLYRAILRNFGRSE